MQSAFERLVIATGVVDLGDAGDEIANGWVLQLIGAGFTGTVQPMAKLPNAAALNYANVAHKKAIDEAIYAVASGPIVNPANEIIEINAGGRQIRLDVVVTAGTVLVLGKPVAGAG